jgi:hypothetical protein
MRNLRMITIAMTMLFFMRCNLYAQEKSVLIKGNLGMVGIEIITIQPDYQVITQEYKRRTNPEESYFLIQLKKEVDKWLTQGYTITESGISLISEPAYSMFYVLTKKE